jgi:hypothetical protein
VFGRAAALFFFLISSAPVKAESYGHISGVILDSSLASVPGALITVVNEDSGLRWTSLSQGDGSYSIPSLQPGSYKITVRKPGFRTMIRFGVKLAAQDSARVDFKLVIGSVQETVTVESSAPLFGAEESSVETIVGRDEIEHLPLDGQGLLGLIGFTPGALVTPATRGESGQFTVDGQRPNTHYFTVDGASANSGVSGGGLPAQSTGGALPSLTAFGSLDSLLTPDALQEMRTQTSSSAPQFGRMPGAQISLTSRSGSNEFHGSLLYGFRNDSLDANNWLANAYAEPRAPLHLNDFSGGLGGPLWRNHTFFFASYEAMRLDQPFTWVQPVPSVAARTNSVAWADAPLSLFPAPNGPDLGSGLALWTGHTSRPSRLDAGAVRIDHTFSSWLTAFARYSESPSSTEFGTTPVNTLDLGFRSVTAGFDVRAKPNLFIDLRLNYSLSTAASVWNQFNGASPCDLEPVTFQFLHVHGVCDYLIRFSIAGIGQVVSGSEGTHTQTQFHFAPTANWTLRTHNVQFGGDFRRLAPQRKDATGSLNIFAESIAALAPAAPNTTLTNCGTAGVVCATSPQFASAALREASLFVEDTWRILPRLTVTYGIRWEISPGPLPGTGSTANFFDPTTLSPLSSRQPLWRSSYANFAPRVGVAFQPLPGGRTFIRGGAGVYYDSSLSLAGDLVNGGPLGFAGLAGPSGIFSSRTLTFVFSPYLHLPVIKQWNISIDRALSTHDVLTVGYVGSSGESLIRREVGPGSSPTALLAIATNDGTSHYNALQAQYRRRLSRGLQALVSYSWSHSVDNSSTDSGLYWISNILKVNQDRASSDFDVRHSFSAGVTYMLPHPARAFLLRDWELDGNFRARSGFPISVLNSDEFQGITYQNVFRPNLIGGVPLWISSPAVPGGRFINPAAFQPITTLDVNGNGIQGNLGRNALTGFGMSQLDLALQRDFVFAEQRSLQFRAEAYNSLNHPNFADPIPYLASPLFGQSTSMLNLMLGTGSPASGLAPIFQSGGPRSLRIVLRFRF